MLSPPIPALRLATALLDLCFPPRCVACAVDVPRAEVDCLGLCPACRRGLAPPVERCRACGRQTGPLPLDLLESLVTRGSRVASVTSGAGVTRVSSGAGGADGEGWEGSPLGCARCAGPNAEADPLSSRPSARSMRRRAVRGVVAAWSYGGVPRALVVALKFHARPAAARPLILALAEALGRASIPGDLVTHVPLSGLRRRQRGYDQAALLSRGVARHLGLEHTTRALRRRRHTAPQSRLSRSARRRAPRGAFRARARAVRGRCVILVDDVLTSGATAHACALALRRAGAAAVIVGVACRAERKRG